MAKKKADASIQEEIATAPEPVVTEQVPTQAANTTEITVKFRDHVGEPTERTFSKEVHGEQLRASLELAR